MSSRIAIVVALFGCVSITAQTPARRTPDLIPKGGKVVVELDVIGAGASLDRLIRMSTLIVDGTVLSALPPINTPINTSRPSSPLIETHSIVAVRTVLKGATPSNASSTILVAEVGGKTDKWDVTVNGDTLLAIGERYILFLASDERRPLPNTSGMPRYAVVGAWSGKAQVIDGKVEFRARASSSLQRSNGLDVAKFVEDIRERIANPPRSTQKLPTHPPPPNRQ